MTFEILSSDRVAPETLDAGPYATLLDTLATTRYEELPRAPLNYSDKFCDTVFFPAISVSFLIEMEEGPPYPRELYT